MTKKKTTKKKANPKRAPSKRSEIYTVRLPKDAVFQQKLKKRLKKFKGKTDYLRQVVIEDLRNFT